MPGDDMPPSDQGGKADPVKPSRPGRLRRMVRFVGSHRLYYSGVALAVIAAGFLGFGFSMRWGAQQWGSFADWIVGGLTLAAVSVALWQAFRAEHARLVDHEMARRRECTKAISDVWSGLAIMSIEMKMLIMYLQDLPKMFDPNNPRSDNQPPDKPDNPLAFDLGERISKFYTTWTATVEPPVFNALTIVRGTPMYEPMRDLVLKYRELIGGEGLETVFKAATFGRRPNVESINARWTEVMSLRQTHLDLAQKHFTLDLTAVEAAVQARRSGTHQKAR